MSKTLIAAATLTIIHGVVDVTKVRVSGELPAWTLFLADQTMHFASIVAVALYIGALAPDETATRLIEYATYFIAGTAAAGHGLRLFLEQYQSIPQRDMVVGSGVSERSSYVIGVAERGLVILMMSFGAQNALAAGLLIAGKSMFRWRERSDETGQLTEYYIVGTLLSMLIAVAAGILCSSALHQVWGGNIRL